MKSLESILLGRIPLEQASSYFVGLKKTASVFNTEGEESPVEIDPDALAAGFRQELETTDDPEEALEVAISNLLEDPGYYGKPKEPSALDEPGNEVKEGSEGMDPIRRLQLAAMYSVGNQRSETRPDLAPHVGAGGAALGAAGAGLGALAGKAKGKGGLGAALGALGGLGAGALGGKAVHGVRAGKHDEGTRDLMVQAASGTPQALLMSHHARQPVQVMVGEGKKQIPVGVISAGNPETGESGYFRMGSGQKEAAAFRLKQAIKKLAADEDTEEMVPPAPPPGSGDLDTEEYLAREQAAMAAQTQAELEYTRQKLREATEQMGLIQQEASQKDQMLSELEQAQAGTQGQIESSLQEGQIAQQAALQNVQSANQQATMALQQALDAENRALEAKRDSTMAKITLQGFRSQLFDMAAAEPPGLMDTAPPVDPSMAGSEAPSVGPEAEEAGPAGEAPGAEAMPNAAPPGGDMSQAPPQAAADGQATPPEADPSATATSEQSSSENPQSNPKVNIKVGNARAMSAAIGGLAGAGITGLEAAGQGPDLDKMRSNIAQKEEQAKQPGVGNFVKALSLAKDKAMLSLGEATQNHPVASTITGGLIGAGVGSVVGPQIASGLGQSRDQIRKAVEAAKNA